MNPKFIGSGAKTSFGFFISDFFTDWFGGFASDPTFLVPAEANFCGLSEIRTNLFNSNDHFINSASNLHVTSIFFIILNINEIKCGVETFLVYFKLAQNLGILRGTSLKGE